MSRQRRNPNPVPNRWMHCPRKASDLIVGKFMAFKTPLSNNFDNDIPPGDRFPPGMLFDRCRTNKIKFGLWVDLTNTTRFYDKAEVEEQGCKYIKLQCRGHGETPSVEQTNTFIQLVHTFIAKNPLECIAVHCTHGFNRTGFLIVSYLVEKMDCSLEIAIEMFARVRSPGIYKGDYLQELYRRYDDIDDPPPPPSLPDWYYEIHEPESNSSGNFNNRTSDPDSASTSSNGSESRISNNSRGTFMEGVPGVTLYTEQPKLHHLQKKVQTMCEWVKKGFPGCQPVSMDLKNMELLSQKPYRVSWKADGMRYMMLIDGNDEIYFFDRDYNVFKVSGLKFPHSSDLGKHLINTLIDGEMVIDKVNGTDIPRYLAYDIVKFEGQDVGKAPFFPTRLQCLENEIIKPRYQAMKNGIINKANEPFSVRKKDFWEINKVASLLGEKFAKTLSHEPDGLIFQPSKEPYVAGRCDDVLKWKPIHMNSVDFRLKIMKEEGKGIVSRKIGYLFVGQRSRPFATMTYTKTLKDLDNKIIECKFEDNKWKFMRVRTDKSYPNSFDTAAAVCNSIQNPVTKENLLNYIHLHQFKDDSEIMPPPTKRIRK